MVLFWFQSMTWMCWWTNLRRLSFRNKMICLLIMLLLLLQQFDWRCLPSSLQQIFRCFILQQKTKTKFDAQLLNLLETVFQKWIKSKWVLHSFVAKRFPDRKEISPQIFSPQIFFPLALFLEKNIFFSPCREMLQLISEKVLCFEFMELLQIPIQKRLDLCETPKEKKLCQRYFCWLVGFLTFFFLRLATLGWIRTYPIWFILSISTISAIQFYVYLAYPRFPLKLLTLATGTIMCSSLLFSYTSGK